MRKRPIYGRSARSTSSKAVASKNHQRQSNYQMQNDNKSLDFVYYSDSEDEAEGKNPDGDKLPNPAQPPFRIDSMSSSGFSFILV